MFQAERIKEMVEAALPDCTALVYDDMNDGEHFRAEIVSSAFAGKNLVAQHRMVNGALKGHLGTDIHALAMKTFTPDTWPHRG